MTTICCKCRKTKVGDDWTKRFISQHQTVSHGYCPRCHNENMKKIMAHLAARSTSPA